MDKDLSVYKILFINSLCIPYKDVGHNPTTLFNIRIKTVKLFILITTLVNICRQLKVYFRNFYYEHCLTK